MKNIRGHKSKTKIIAAVEIGTAKVNVVVGELAAGRALNIIGHCGECLSRGVVKGSIVDLVAASEAVHGALEAAEKSAGRKVEGVFLAQSGGHLGGFYNHAEIAVSSADNIVGATDIAAVCESAKKKEIPVGRVVIHNVRQSFTLDGRLVENPLGMHGGRLGVGYWVTHGAESEIANALHIVSGCAVRVDELMLSSLASGAMVTTPDERRRGVVVIDIGAGVSDFAWYRHGHARVTGALRVGGNHLVDDLCAGLRTQPCYAEQLLLRFGCGTATCRDKTRKTWLETRGGFGDREIPVMSVEQITAARVGEIFEIIRKMLGAEFAPHETLAGVVLTGGVSKLAGIEQAAANAFGCAARVGEIPETIHESLRGPENATALGILHLGLEASERDRDRQARHKTLSAKLSGLMKRWFCSERGV